MSPFDVGAASPPSTFQLACLEVLVPGTFWAGLHAHHRACSLPGTQQWVGSHGGGGGWDRDLVAPGVLAAPRSASSLGDLEAAEGAALSQPAPGGHLVPRQLCPLLSRHQPYSHWGSRAQPCVAYTPGPSCPPCQGPQPPSLSGHSPMLSAPFHHFGGCSCSILRWKHLNPVPTATPAQCPPPPPCKWGPHVRCGRMSWPGLPNAPGSCPGRRRCRWRELREHGNRRLPPAWKHTGGPLGGGSVLATRCCCGVLGQAGSGGLGVGEGGMVWAAPAWRSYFGPSEVRPWSLTPTCRLKDPRASLDLTEGPHLTEAALPLPVLLGFLLKLL